MKTQRTTLESTEELTVTLAPTVSQNLFLFFFFTSTSKKLTKYIIHQLYCALSNKALSSYQIETEDFICVGNTRVKCYLKSI